jgi:transcriptional regulator with XRE-family HTH domain
MITDPLLRLPSAFGNVLVRSGHVRNWSAEALANASDLSLLEIRSIEAGQQIPTLADFFQIATGLGEASLILRVGYIPVDSNSD